VTLYLYINRKYINTKGVVAYIVILPPLTLYILLGALQYQTGGDYDTYVAMYENGVAGRILLNKEYLFVLLLEFAKFFSLGGHSIIVMMSVLQGYILFFFVLKIRNYNYSVWLIVFLILFCTSIYFNQMNLMRQYVAVLLTPLFFLYLYEKRYFSLIIVSFLALMAHKSFLLVIVFSPLFVIFKRFAHSDGRLFLLFLLSPVAILYLFPIVYEFFINNIFYHYDLYKSLYSDFSTDRVVRIIIGKLYFFPIMVYFWYIYLLDKRITVLGGVFRDVFLPIFALTHAFYLVDFTIYVHGRVFVYFIIFYIFPLYYLLYHHYLCKYKIRLMFVIFYIVAPVFYKIFIFNSNEYNYRSILF